MNGFASKLALAAILQLAMVSAAQTAEKISFNSSSTYFGNKVELRGELHKPSGTRKYPLAMLLHGCGGLHPPVVSAMRTHAKTLNRAGVAALILDSFGPRNVGGGWVCQSLSRLSAARGYRAHDVRDAAAHLRSRNDLDLGRLFLLGHSNGASVAVSMARTGKVKGLRGAIAYYPWCGTVGTSSKVPLLVLSGEDDDWTPPADCIRKADPGRGITVVTYPDTVHSFVLPIGVTNYQGHKVGGNPKAAANSRSRYIRFIKNQLK